MTPHVDARGVHLFDVEEIRSVMVTVRRTRSSAGDVDGEIAATIFRMFNEGKSAIDVITALEVHPDAVEKLYKQWARLRVAFVVDATIVEQLVDELVSMRVDVRRIDDAAALLAAIRSLRDGWITEPETRCRACVARGEAKPRRATHCEGCSNRRASDLARKQIDAVIEKPSKASKT